MFITKKRKQSDPCIHPNSMQVKTPTSDGLNHPCQYSNLMEHSILLYTTNPLTKPQIWCNLWPTLHFRIEWVLVKSPRFVHPTLILSLSSHHHVGRVLVSDLDLFIWIGLVSTDCSVRPHLDGPAPSDCLRSDESIDNDLPINPGRHSLISIMSWLTTSVVPLALGFSIVVSNNSDSPADNSDSLLWSIVTALLTVVPLLVEPILSVSYTHLTLPTKRIV